MCDEKPWLVDQIIKRDMRLPQKPFNWFSFFLLAEIGIRGEFIGTIWIYWNLLHRLGWNIWIYRRKFRSQTSDNMDRWKAEQGRGREKRKIRRKKSRRERVRRKKMQMREKLGKSRNTVFFQWFGAQEGRKVGWRVRSQLARWEMKICTPLWREAHFQVNMYKTHHSRTTFGSWDVEKVHAVVARSTFRCQHVKSTRGSDHFWRFRCRFATLHYITLHYTPLHCTTLHYITQQLQLHNYTPLHSTTLHNTKSHYTTLHYTTLHSTTLHYTTLHFLPLHFTTLHYSPLHYNYNYTTTLHYNTLHHTKITLHYITLHSTTLHYATLPSTTLHYITLHYTPLHYNYEYTTTLHYTPLH